MWPVKKQNKEHTNAIVEVMGKWNITNFRIFWNDYNDTWRGCIEWTAGQAKYERDFTTKNFEELVKEMAEFSEKNLLIEIK